MIPNRPAGLKLTALKDVGTDSDTDWFYIKKGETKHAGDNDTTGIMDGMDTIFVKREKIDGKYFAFNEKGQTEEKYEDFLWTVKKTYKVDVTAFVKANAYVPHIAPKDRWVLQNPNTYTAEVIPDDDYDISQKNTIWAVSRKGYRLLTIKQVIIIIY